MIAHHVDDGLHGLAQEDHAGGQRITRDVAAKALSSAAIRYNGTPSANFETTNAPAPLR
jgi:hypothetical protein